MASRHRQTSRHCPASPWQDPTVVGALSADTRAEDFIRLYRLRLYRLRVNKLVDVKAWQHRQTSRHDRRLSSPRTPSLSTDPCSGFERSTCCAAGHGILSNGPAIPLSRYGIPLRDSVMGYRYGIPLRDSVIPLPGKRGIRGFRRDPSLRDREASRRRESERRRRTSEGESERNSSEGGENWLGAGHRKRGGVGEGK